MKPVQFCSCVYLLVAGIKIILCKESYINYGGIGAISNETMATYGLGVHMGIINPQIYSLISFHIDEREIFKKSYQEFISSNVTHPMSYQKWLIMNNYGILPDTQQSLLRRKATKRRVPDNEDLFLNTVRKGDILISGTSRGGLIGHAAIMTTDYWVLEMKGGSRWAKGIPDNNRQLSKDCWYDKYDSDWITVYRCPDNEIARAAAVWADRNYYNPNGGSEKRVHITYKLTDDLWEVNPSYDSKLVIQAYYFGLRRRCVVKDLSKIDHVIFPVNIPKYFYKGYKLINKGEF